MFAKNVNARYVRQFFYEIMSASLYGGFDEFFLRDVFSPVSNIIGDRHSEENRLLGHYPDLISEPMNIQIGQFDRI